MYANVARHLNIAVRSYPRRISGVVLKEGGKIFFSLFVVN